MTCMVSEVCGVNAILHVSAVLSYSDTMFGRKEGLRESTEKAGHTVAVFSRSTGKIKRIPNNINNSTKGMNISANSSRHFRRLQSHFFQSNNRICENIVIVVVVCCIDCFTSHVGEHRTVRGLWKRQGIPCFFQPEEEMPFVYVTLATLVTLATAGIPVFIWIRNNVGWRVTIGRTSTNQNIC